METIYLLLLIGGIVLNIVAIIAFFQLCGNVRKLTEKFCSERPEPLPAQEDAESMEPFEVGDHVMDGDVELVVADRNGTYYKCNRADTMEFYGVIRRSNLVPAPGK